MSSWSSAGSSSPASSGNARLLAPSRWNGSIDAGYGGWDPALLVTVAVSYVLGVLLFSPLDLVGLSKSTVAALLQVSNLLFWREAGYFDSSKLVKPLLHTWSIGVEVQFYLLWPFLVRALATRGSIAFARSIVLGVALLSLAASHVWLLRDSTAVFYLTPFRMWEFAAGGLVWLTGRQKRPQLVGRGIVPRGAAGHCFGCARAARRRYGPDTPRTSRRRLPCDSRRQFESRGNHPVDADPSAGGYKLFRLLNSLAHLGVRHVRPWSSWQVCTDPWSYFYSPCHWPLFPTCSWSVGSDMGSAAALGLPRGPARVLAIVVVASALASWGQKRMVVAPALASPAGQFLRQSVNGQACVGHRSEVQCLHVCVQPEQEQGHARRRLSGC